MLRPPPLATTLLRRFGPQDDSIEGDLFERFQRSGSRMWYWRQVANALRVATVREITWHPIALSATVMLGWVVWWVLFHHLALSGLFAVDHAIFMSSMRQGYDVPLFGQVFLWISWVVAVAAEAISAIVAVRVYPGHRPVLAVLYAGAVIVRCVGSLTLNSIYYDSAASPLR